MKQQISLEFQVKSTDPHRSTSKTIPEIRALSSDLQAAVSERLPGAKVRIRRVEGLPLLPELQHILLQVDWDAVRKGAESAASAFLTTEFLKTLKRRIHLLQAKRVAAPAKIAAAAKKSPAAKKKTGRPPRKKAK